MRYAALAALVAIAAMSSLPSWAADHSVRGYVKKDGIYVAPHRQTNPNRTKTDNYSTRGNANPYTGKRGTRSP